MNNLKNTRAKLAATDGVPPSWQELRAFEEEARRNNLYALSSWSYSVVGVLGLLLPGPGGVENCFSCLCLLQSVLSYLSDVHFVGTNTRMWVLDITCATVTFFSSMGIWGVSTGTFALKYALGVSCLACSATLFRMQHRLFRPLHIGWHALPFPVLGVRPHDEVGAKIMVLAALPRRCHSSSRRARASRQRGGRDARWLVAVA